MGPLAPGPGDAAKIIVKLKRHLKNLAKILRILAKNGKLLEKALPRLRKILKGLDAIDLDCLPLPKSLRDELAKLRDELRKFIDETAPRPFQGMTNKQIVRSLPRQQLDLLRQWMGTGAQGARQAMGRPLPQGLTADTLRAYQEIARRQIEAGQDTLGTQAARLELIEQALRAMGH